MDNGSPNYAEHRITKKVEGMYRLKRNLYKTACVLLPLMFPLIGLSVKQLSWLIWATPIAVFFVIMIARQLYRYLQIEYEYSVLVGAIKVEYIYGNMRRSDMVEAKFSDMSVIAPYEGEYKTKADAPDIKRRYEAISSFSSPDVYFGTFVNSKNERSVLFFEPTNKIIKLAKLYNPSTVVKQVTF